MDKLDLTFILIIGICLFEGVSGFSCYACEYTYNQNKKGYECVTNPHNYTEGPNTIECPVDEMCFSEKIISKFTNDIDMLRRGCGYQSAGCEEDTYEKHCIQTCTEHSLCNDWNEQPATTTTTSTTTTTMDPNTFVKCYACQYVRSEGGDTDCIYHPETQDTTNCYAGSQCYFFQQSELGGGAISTFERSCGKSFTGSGCVITSYHENCHETCFADFCNDAIGGSNVLRCSWITLFILVSTICTYIFDMK